MINNNGFRPNDMPTIQLIFMVAKWIAYEGLDSFAKSLYTVFSLLAKTQIPN